MNKGGTVRGDKTEISACSIVRVSCSSKKKCNTRLIVAFEKKIFVWVVFTESLVVKSLRKNLTVIFEIDLYGTLDCVNVAEVECGVIWTKHGTYTMLTPNTLYHTSF